MEQINEITAGRRIRSARVQKGLQQKQLAQDIGIAPNYLGMIERDLRNGSKMLYRKIAERLGVTYEWIVDGSKTVEKEEEHGAQFKSFEEDIWNVVDLGMFISILCRENPAINEEYIAKNLGIELEIVRDIVDGKQMAYDESWGPKLSTLAQKYCFEMCDKIEYLTVQLLKEKTRAEAKIIRNAIQDYICRKEINQFTVTRPKVYRQLNGLQGIKLPYVMEIIDVTEGEYSGQWIFCQVASSGLEQVDESAFQYVYNLAAQYPETTRMMIVCINKKDYQDLRVAYEDIVCGNYRYESENYISLLYVDAVSEQVEDEIQVNGPSEEERSINKKSSIPEMSDEELVELLRAREEYEQSNFEDEKE